MMIVTSFILASIVPFGFTGSLKKGPSECDQLVLTVAQNDLGTARHLLERGADSNCTSTEGLPMLIYAASHKQGEMVNLLLEYKANPNAICHNPKQGFNKTPALMFPAANGSVDILISLLDAGADRDARDGTGLTPLMSAAFMGHEKIVEALLGRGAEIEQKDESGYTALMFAANAGRLEAAGVLLKNKAAVNTKDKDGSTPIMFATQHGFSEVVKLLLSHGADPTIKGRHGLSAIDFAKLNNQSEVLRIFKNRRKKKGGHS